MGSSPFVSDMPTTLVSPPVVLRSLSDRSFATRMILSSSLSASTIVMFVPLTVIFVKVSFKKNVAFVTGSTRTI